MMIHSSSERSSLFIFYHTFFFDPFSFLLFAVSGYVSSLPAVRTENFIRFLNVVSGGLFFAPILVPRRSVLLLPVVKLHCQEAQFLLSSEKERWDFLDSVAVNATVFAFMVFFSLPWYVASSKDWSWPYKTSGVISPSLLNSPGVRW